MHFFWVFITGIIFLAGPMPAWADIDYHCLGNCVNGGKTTQFCMTQCTYNATDPSLLKNPADKNAANAKKLSPKEFSPLVLSDGRIVLPPPSTGQAPVGKDYLCINQCLQSGSQYTLCERQCTPDPRKDIMIPTNP